MSRVLAYVNERDFRVNDRLLGWTPPRWFRVFMLSASRLGDGWLWLLTGALLLATGAHKTLAAGAVSMGMANVLLVMLKRRFHRRRPCDYSRHPAFDVRPLAFFKEDCFSFPSGHTLNAFALGSVVALSFPPLAPAVLFMAGSIGASRVVLGLHFVSDVLAGATLGLAIGAGVFAWLVA
jgi:undecaprenyl-diphosphatase